MYKALLPLGLFVLAASACKTTKQAAETPLVVEATEFTQLDTLVVAAEAVPKAPEDYTLPVYRASQDRPNDLQHTELHVRFDWPKEQVIGQATLTFTPTFYPQDHLVLDAKNFEVKEVRLGGKTGTVLKYSYDGKLLDVALDRSYTREESYKVYVDYVATPAADGGSAAITSDKGLFFIDPRDEDPEKPSQIWTQGETEHNSNWLPTIDQPNERSTQEFFITVEDKYKTLSNGLLVSSTPAGNGMRTDQWKMELPHAPYLYMMAVGEFAKVDETWDGIPLSYYVEEDYRPYAKEIFAHTPEMLTFFSELTGVRYPWPKYSQIVVRDYVSGAMENTSAVIFGEFVQKDDRELAEDNNDLIVAHELFHHWFGDLVTCESWSNLTLNEGFANYSEYLWFEHHNGMDAAESHRLDELQGYLGSAGGAFHPLIWYQWQSNEDMFDGHSYNKGGLALHMLRGLLGDEAFFASLKRYLTDNQYTAVEVDELRMAFEDVTGQDLQWFFDQWFIGNGHPEYTVDYAYGDGKALVTVEQTQDPDVFRPIFILPTKIGVYPAGGGSPTIHEVTMNLRKQTFEVAAGPEDVVVFDPETRILGVRNEERTLEDQLKIFERVPDLQRRLFAARAISASAQDSTYTPSLALTQSIIGDPFYRVRNNGINLADVSNPAVVAQLKQIARTDKQSNSRANAMRRLLEVDDPTLGSFYTEVLDKEQSYTVLTSGLQGLLKVDPEEAMQRAAALEDTESESLLAGIASVYASSGDAGKMGFFESNLDKVDNQAAGEFAGAYVGLALQNGPEALTKAVTNLGSRAQDQSTSLWRRFGFMSALGELKGLVNSPAASAQPGLADAATLIGEQIEAIKAAETNPQLKAMFGRM